MSLTLGLYLLRAIRRLEQGHGQDRVYTAASSHVDAFSNPLRSQLALTMKSDGCAAER